MQWWAWEPPYDAVDEPFAKILFCDWRLEAMAEVERVLKAHPRAEEFSFVRSEKYLYEILPKDTHKGRVLRPLAEHLGVDPRRTVAIGDYDNDIGMLREAAVGVAVANASPAALAAADRVTVSNEEHAIARLISDIESGAISFCG
ncbi:MAG: HAD hydrolase family protein [Clostridia bacterium]|nr:HAD hydrolase family protein [Clostridia bacterium]